MGLTKHLYREDEVIAALLYCTVKGRVPETAFWALELIDSDMCIPMLQTLVRSWLWFFGIRELGWFTTFATVVSAEEIDVDACLDLAIHLSMCRRTDGSILGLLAYGLQEGQTEPDRAGVKGAWMQGKGRLAWSLSLDRWDELPGIALEKHGVEGKAWVDRYLTAEHWMGDALWSEEFLWPFRAAAVALICLPTIGRSSLKPDIPSHVQKDIEAWKAAEGRRSRRTTSIPIDCLAFLTKRGREQSVYDTNENELMGSITRALRGSVYWESIAEQLGGWAAIRYHDDTREDFFDTFFPDDIPDEWSSKERDKSHGRGILQKGKGPDVMRFYTTWFRTIRCFVCWGGEKALAKLGMGPHEISAAYVKRETELIAQMKQWTQTRVQKTEIVIV
jgi:hypothetical protein